MTNPGTPAINPSYAIRTMKTRVAIFDDNRIISDNITSILNSDETIDIVGVFNDASNCVVNVLRCKPDVVLMDLKMHGISGIEAISLVKKQLPDVKILVQTIYEDEEYILSAIVAGASGYILKNQLSYGLANSIRELQSDGSPFSPPIARRILNYIRHGFKSDDYTHMNYNLTAREKEVLSCIVDGLSHKMIGYKLNISYETVRSHVKKIYEKMSVSSLTEVVAKAINQHLV